MYGDKKAIECSLYVYRMMREHLLKDTKEKAADLYFGLYSTKSSQSRNYIERYKIIWQLSHAEFFHNFMEKNSITEKKIYQKVFSKSYREFLEQDKRYIYNIDLTVKVLKGYQHILEQMIDTSISWERGYDKLRTAKRKQEEEWNRLKEEMECERWKQ